MPSQHDTESSSFRFLLVNFDAEDLERYEPGGFHPVHLGDRYDGGRYRVVHKLGAGGFSTVWLARDEAEDEWVALKIVVADASTSVEDKRLLSHRAALQHAGEATFVVEHRHFTFHGPNGRHLCLVFPVLGPSASRLSSGFTSRIRPWLARRAAYLATQALANLHAQSLCHGDVTTANIVFSLLDINQYTEDDIYDSFGTPKTQPLETESGDIPGPEAPRYIVKTLDFLSSEKRIIVKGVKLIDFDQCFPVTSPPKQMLGTPAEFLAPEVAVGLEASPASGVWALDCSIFRIRSGECPFPGYEVTSPADLMRVIIQALGDLPDQWGDPLFDYDGQPTSDSAKGEPLQKYDGKRSIEDLVYKIYDQPKNGIVKTGKVWPEPPLMGVDEDKPYPPCFSDMFWKPTATKIDNTCLYGYDYETDKLLEVMPKISKDEATLLYDPLSKIFVYDPLKRITAAEMLNHPWFHMDGQCRPDSDKDSLGIDL